MCPQKFRKIHRKTHVSESLFLIKLQVETYKFINQETLTQVFPCEFCKIFKNTFFTEHLWMVASGLLLLFFLFDLSYKIYI